MVECILRKDLNASADDVEAVMSESAKLAGVTLTGGTDFVLNNHTITSASLTGASVTFDSLNANITIPTAVQNVSVMGGAIQASIKGNTLYLLNASNPSLESADFVVEPANVTLNAYEPVTISAFHQGDGVVNCYTSRFAQIEQLNATEFRVSPKYAGSGDIGFFLSETEDYYGASKNVNIVCPDDSAVEILMHFDEENNIFKNSGKAEITSNTYNQSSAYYYVAEGKFEGCFAGATDGYLSYGCYIGGKDFTLDFWSLYSGNVSGMVRLAPNSLNGYFMIAPGITESSIVVLPKTGTTSRQTFSADWVARTWNHCAITYQHSTETVRVFRNGELVVVATETPVARVAFEKLQIANDIYVDEFRYLDGVCAWTEDFTPPTQPY